LSAIHGQASAELEQNLQQAYALCQDMNDPGGLVPVLAALTRLYMVRADRAATDTLVEQERQLLSLAVLPADAIYSTPKSALLSCGVGCTRSQEHYRHALERYEALAHRSLLLTFGFDPKSVALASCGWSLCLSGWPEQAWNWERRARRALRLINP